MGLIVKQSGTLGPVTALSICGDKLLAGCGQLIQVYSLENGLLELSLQGLSHSNIHGIRPGPFIAGATHLCLFGGKQSRVLAIKSKSSECMVDECSSEGDFEDWLWDAAWLQKQDWWTIGFALAHNIVLHWDWRNSKILQRVTCTENCLLYCARFIGSNWSELLLAVGTVFNNVVLWSVGDRHNQSMSDGFFVEPDDRHQSRQVLCRLTGHEGVIFSINYQPKLQRLCSVSDDRSIRVWQIHSASSNTECIPLSSLDWNYVHIEPLLTLYGHSARVWDAVLLSEKIISVGEDACCLVWNYRGEIMQQFRGHKGRSIWSVAASEDESFVVTGGGDASLRQWHLKDAAAVELSHVVLPIPDDIKISEDFIRTLTLWNFDTVVLATNQGMLLAHNISDGSWKKLWHDTAFSSYVTLAFSPSRTFLAIGNVTGLVAVFKRHEAAGLSILLQGMIQPHKGKVCGLTWVDERHFVTTGLHGHCVMTRVYLDVEENRAISLEPVTQLELPESQHRWVTAGCLLSSLLVCGDRCGSIYKYGLSISADETHMCRPTQIFKKIHGSAGVTCICYHDSTIFTAGRDGQYRQWTIKNGDLELLNTSRVFKGFDWIDRLVFQENEFQVMGFYSSKFIVWSVTKGEQLLEVECGGGHRAWDCVYQGCICHFLFLKAQQVTLVTSNQKNRQVIIKPSLHGQKVWAMKHLYTRECFPGRPVHVVCMASEDTTVSIGTLWAENGSLHWLPQHTIHSHLSSVRALAVVDETIYPVPYIYKTAKKHGQKQCMSQGNHQGCTSWTEQCSGDILAISQDTGTLSLNEAYDKLSSALGADRSCTANQENTKEWLHSQTKIVFSGGGRAQIQAWRVLLEPNTRAYLKQGELSQDCKLFRSSAQLTQDQKPIIPPTLHAGSSELQSSVQSSYKHLGSCFLGEARHKRSAKPWKTRYLKLDPETRIMDLAAIATQSVDSRLPAGTYLLAAAGSDGVLRLFLFEERSCLFFLLCQSSYHSGCLLKVYMHLLPDDNYSRPVLLSAATDGKIALWDLQPVCVWLLQHFFQEPETVSEDSSDDEDSHIYQESKNRESYAWHGCSNHKIQTAMDKKTGCQTDSDQRKLRSTISEGSNINNQSFFYRNFADSPATDTAKYDSEDAEEEENEEELSSGGFVTEENANDLSKTKAQDLTESQQTSLQGFLLVNSACEWIPNKEVKSHQSGINSLHMKSFGERQVLLASGGDDNSLTVHYLRFGTPCTADMEHQLFQVESTVARSDAHAGQITGIWILSERLVLTSSLDQRVSLWHLTEEENILKIAMKDSQFVDIADLSNIDVWQHRCQIHLETVCQSHSESRIQDPHHFGDNVLWHDVRLLQNLGLLAYNELNQNIVHVGVCGEGIALLTLQL